MGVCENNYEESKDNLMKEYRDVFNFYDVKGRGYLDKNDFMEILDRIGLNVSMEKITDVAKRLSILNENRTKLEEINFDDFVSLMMSIDSKNWICEDEMHLVFQQFDKDADGFISGKDLRKLLSSLGENIDDNELREMMLEADQDGDGKVNYNEFIRVMTNTSNKSSNKKLKSNSSNEASLTESKPKNSHISSPSKKNKPQTAEEKHNYKQRRTSRLLQIQEQVSRIRMEITVRRILNKGSWN